MRSASASTETRSRRRLRASTPSQPVGARPVSSPAQMLSTACGRLPGRSTHNHVGNQLLALEKLVSELSAPRRPLMDQRQAFAEVRLRLHAFRQSQQLQADTQGDYQFSNTQASLDSYVNFLPGFASTLSATTRPAHGPLAQQHILLLWNGRLAHHPAVDRQLWPPLRLVTPRLREEQPGVKL